jgi:hypothetical protein
MIETLKIRIKESERPIGVKRSSKIKLPPEDHVYGFQVKKDPEGVDTSKSFLIFNYIFIVYFSYKKLENS